MTVVHVIRSLDPAMGGPTFCATRLAAAQAGLGRRVRMVFYGQDDQERNRIAAELAALPSGAAVELAPLTPERALERLLVRQARAGVASAIRDATMVHLHGVWERLLGIAASAAARAGFPYAITPHGMLDPWSLAQARFKKKTALAVYARRILNRAAFIHALNGDEARLLAPLRLRPPVRVIPNGVFLEELGEGPGPAPFRAAHPELGADPYILFLARLHHKKGLDFLADAFAAVLATVPAARLVIAGPDGGEEAPFRERTRALGVAGRTHIVGPLYGSSKWSALAGAACFCLPSRQEGFSVAVLEAMACGVPAVISDQCHFPELAEGGGGLVVPLDPRALGTALVRVLSSPGLAGAMGASGRAMVSERYTWPRIAQAMLASYQNGAPEGRVS